VNRAEVGGVDADPGNLELDWLEVQLDLFRQRGVKVWIIGHVPPSTINYYPECYWRYAELVLRYQDTIVGQLFGHMNTDHFAYVGTRDLQHPKEENTRYKSKKNLFQILMRSFARLEKPSQLDLDTFSVIHTSPSVVPNPYLPTLRVWSYNVSGLGVVGLTAASERIGRKNGSKGKDARPSKKRCKRREDKYKWWCQLPKRPWYSDENAPSRKNGPLTPLGYVQWWMPDMDVPVWAIEYATYDQGTSGNLTEQRKPNHAHGKLIPESGDPGVLLPWGLADGTIGSWIGLAERIGRNKEMQDMFYKLMYLGGNA